MIVYFTTQSLKRVIIVFFSRFATGVILCFLFLWRNAASWRKSFLRKRSSKWYYSRYSWRLQSSHIWKFVFRCWFMQLYFRYVLICWPIRILNFEFQLNMIQSASMVVSHFSPRVMPVAILATYRKSQIAVVLDHLLKMTPLAPLVVNSANAYRLEVVILIWKDAILKFFLRWFSLFCFLPLSMEFQLQMQF